MILKSGVATSVGSLPHHDPVAAVELELARHPDLPASPWLPRRSLRERLISRAAVGVAGLGVDDAGSLIVDIVALDPDAPLDPAFPPDAFGGLHSFLDAVEDREGPIKLQITGPVSLSLALIDAGVDVSTSLEVAAAAVVRRAEALVALAHERAPLADRLVTLDEPGLLRAAHPAFPHDVEAALDAVDAVRSAVAGAALTGIHVCGTTDWDAVGDLGFDVLSLPLEAAAQSPAMIAGHLDDGGWVAWGAVPLDEPVGTTGEGLWRRLAGVWSALIAEGCDEDLLASQALVTPTCGLAGHGESQSDRVLDLTDRIAEKLREQFLSVSSQAQPLP